MSALLFGIVKYVFLIFLGIPALLVVLALAWHALAEAINSCRGKWASRTPEGAKRWADLTSEKRRKWDEALKKRRIVGKLYLITSKDLQQPELWLTEEDGTPYDLFSKFGWFRHKQSRVARSSTHNMFLMGENVLFDSKVHKHFNPRMLNGEDREIRLIRFDAQRFSERLHNVYTIIDRVKQKVSKCYVPVGRVDEFLASNGPEKFTSVVCATTNYRFVAGVEKMPRVERLIYTGGELGPDWPAEKSEDTVL